MTEYISCSESDIPADARWHAHHQMGSTVVYAYAYEPGKETPNEVDGYRRTTDRLTGVVHYERSVITSDARIAKLEIQIADRDCAIDYLHDQIKAASRDPIPMRLTCPVCGELHLDEGEFATKPHHTHACQECGNVWRPAIVTTVGVKFLPGFKNGATP